MSFTSTIPKPSFASIAKKHLLLAVILVQVNFSFGQKTKVDSFSRLLETEEIDSNRVKLLWNMARDIGVYNPDTALVLSFQAYSLARKIKYLEGESRSLGVMANTFIKIGNYPRALELNIEKLKLEEKRNVPRNLASVLMNIAVVYGMQEEYDQALYYYAKSDSVIRRFNVDDLRYYIALNTGDTYDHLDQSDSSFIYFSRALEIARQQEDGDLIGASMTGLGHSFRKLGRYNESKINYQTGIGYLKEANDDEILCEAALGLAKLYEILKEPDSARSYANLSMSIAKKDGFLSKELDAAQFLTDHYKKLKDIDSAFSYVGYTRGLNDSVYSKSKIRESQVISSNEQFRQMQLEEERTAEQKKRFQQLQMLLIAIFIPGFFLITVFLSKANVHIKLIKLLGVLSLLFLFEYLTLLLHPTIANLTHHTPVYEILIFVGLAAILIPAHHKLEHWMIMKLIHHRKHAPVHPQEGTKAISVK